MLTSLEQKYIKLKQDESSTKNAFSTAQSDNSVLNTSLTAQSDKLRKCKEEICAEYKKKLESAKQLAVLCKKGDLEELLTAASRDHSEARKLLSDERKAAQIEAASLRRALQKLFFTSMERLREIKTVGAMRYLAYQT